MNAAQSIQTAKAILAELGYTSISEDLHTLLVGMVEEFGNIECDELIITLESELGLSHADLENTEAYDECLELYI